MKCPLLNKECIKDKCAWWTTVMLVNSETKEQYPEYKCAINTIGPMLIDIIRNTGRVQAAIESSREETTKRQDEFLNLVKIKQISR